MTVTAARARSSGVATRIGIQGEPGSFSEEAAHRATAGAIEPVPFRDFLDVTRALASRTIDIAVLPVENSLAGSVVASYDAILAEPDVHAIGEVVIPIRHCLLGVKGATLDDVVSVESHPMALAQCREFLRARPQLDVRASYDTAGSARDVVRRGDARHAAIASARAAERHGLTVLARNVEDRTDNATRFLILSTADMTPDPSTRVRTIAVYTTANVPGALLRTLEPLHARHMNMVALQARPAGTPWSYRFIVEFEHTGGLGAASDALEEMSAHTETLHRIGTFAPQSFHTSSRVSEPALTVNQV